MDELTSWSDSEYEPDLELHLIMDNYDTHKHEKVHRFLDRHPILEEISPGCTKPKRWVKKAT
jgi:hypothetical protein